MRIIKFWFLLMVIVTLALVLAGCEKTGEPVGGNVAPDTRILSYVISTAAELDTLGDPTTNYSVTVYWAGSDIDGAIKTYLYQDDGGNSGEIPQSQGTFVYDFANATAEYVLQVTAVDNENLKDPTPAEITIKRDFGGVETTVIDGPPNGATVSPAFRYKVGTSSQTGTITGIEYKVNDGSWTSVNVDEFNQAEIDIIGAPVGGVVVFFRGVRDDGVMDETHASASVVVREGYFPTIINTSPVGDGGGWFAGVQIDFSWTMVMGYYYGIAPDDAWSYAFNDNINWDDSDDPLASGWTTATAWSAADSLITAGTQVLYLKSRDYAGGKGLLSITITVAEFNPTLGLFVRSDFSWDGGYPSVIGGTETIKEIVDRGFFKDWTYTASPSSAPALTPGDIGSYSSLVVYGDGGYNNQANGALFAAYGTAGGNLMLCGYEMNDWAPHFAAFGITPAVYSSSNGNYGGMDGVAGTAYEGTNVILPDHLTNRSYHRVYPDQANTSSIFQLHPSITLTDTRSCGVRADMPGGNVVIVIGQSIPFFNHDDQKTIDLGNMILSTEFGETK